jgi:hypothetical protein
MIFILLSQLANAGENNKVRPLINPIIGTYSYRVSDNTDNFLDNASFKGFRVGGAVGVKYKSKQKGLAKVLPNVTGRTRVLYTTTVASDATITDYRIGTFIGPKWGPVKVEIGVDGIRTENQLPEGYAQDPYRAVATPLNAIFDIKLVKVQAMVSPQFFLGGERDSVDFSQKMLPGFGNEMEYGISGRVGLGPVGIGLSYSTRVTAYGNDTTVGVGIGL